MAAVREMDGQTRSRPESRPTATEYNKATVTPGRARGVGSSKSWTHQFGSDGI